MVDRISPVEDISGRSRYKKCEELFCAGKPGWVGLFRQSYYTRFIQCFPCHLGFPPQSTRPPERCFHLSSRPLSRPPSRRLWRSPSPSSSPLQSLSLSADFSSKLQDYFRGGLTNLSNSMSVMAFTTSDP